MLLTSIKSLGKCPCPRCLIQKDQIDALGTTADRQRRNKTRKDDAHRWNNIKMVRTWIFEKGYSLVGKAVERVLGMTSSVPVLVR